ncbi:MAG: glycosyl hydrolase [Candidatus Solibacter sp.]|nr:glycosyl hydrolase [Candidatus Solibacter sp.]
MPNRSATRRDFLAARFDGGRLLVRGQAYRALILQRSQSIPIATLRAIGRFVDAGGVAIALDSLPSRATGMADWRAADDELRRLVESIWRPGRGAHFIPGYKFTNVPFVSNEQPPRKTPPLQPGQIQLLETLGKYISLDFLRESRRQSDGLTFHHRRAGEADIFFVANMQAEPSRETVSFAVRGKRAQVWNGMDGGIEPVGIEERDGRTHLAVDLAPWESRFFVFAPGLPLEPAKRSRAALPPVEIPGPWQLKLEGARFPRTEKTVERLAHGPSWACRIAREREPMA